MNDEVAPTAEVPPAPTASWVSGVPMWARIAVPAVVLVLVVAVVILAIPHSKNAQACSDFEKAYNSLADSVSLKLGPDLVAAARDNLVTAASDAHDEAVGAVKADLSEVVTFSDGFVSGDSDSGVAFFLASASVAKSCTADGAGITLKKI